RLYSFARIAALSRHFIEGRCQVAVFIEIADDAFRCIPRFVIQKTHAQLRAQVIRECLRLGKEGLKRWLLDRFCRRTAIARIEVIVEERTEVDLVEWGG